MSSRRSGYMLQEGQAVEFAETVESMLQRALGLDPDAQPELDDEDAPAADEAAAADDGDAEELPAEDHDEL